jgi:DnaJ-class molecular chaperone
VAYQVLSNRDKRSRYDRYGPGFERVQPQHDHGFFFQHEEAPV